MTSDKTVINYLAGRICLAVESESRVSEALDIMDLMNVHALGIHCLGKFTGIFTHSDFLRRVLRRDLNPSLTRINDVMTLNPRTVSPECGIREAYAAMIRHKVNCLPVVDSGMNFKGIITEDDLRCDIQDLMERTSREYKMAIEYIHGENYGLCVNY